MEGGSLGSMVVDRNTGKRVTGGTRALCLIAEDEKLLFATRPHVKRPHLDDISLNSVNACEGDHFDS